MKPASLWSRFTGALRNLVTGRDNQTWDLARVSWAGSFLAILAAAAWHEAHQVRVDLQQLAIALSAISAAHGAAIGIKANSEPTPGGDS